jgi:hypothetical protein
MLIMSFQRWQWRIVLCAAMFAMLLTVWHRVQNPWWDNEGDIQEMLDNQQDGTGNEGVDEYVPIGVDPYEVDQKARLVRFEGHGQPRINIQTWDAEKRRIAVDTKSPGKLVLRLFNYPLWKTEVNGHPVETTTAPDTGQMIVPISSGENRVQISFVDGWDRKAGSVLSVCAFLIIAFMYALWNKSQAPLPAES